MKKLILLFAAFSAFSCFAQKASSNDIKKMFGDKTKNDIELEGPDHSGRSGGSYWIENDTLFALWGYFGDCIAMQDIDFTNKSVRPSPVYFVKGSSDHIYILSIVPVSGKNIYQGSCYADIPDLHTPTIRPMEIYARDMDQADAIFSYLRNWKKGDSPKKLPSRKPAQQRELSDKELQAMMEDIPVTKDSASDYEWSKELGELFKQDPFTNTTTTAADQKTAEQIKEETAADEKKFMEILKEFDGNTTASETTRATTPNSNAGFDPQMADLVAAYKNGWGTLKGGLIRKDEYKSTVNLPGSETKIETGILGEYTMLADFGEYKNKEEAQKVYEEVVRKVDASQGIPFSMIKQNEYVSASGKTTVWVPFDPPAGFEKMSIWVETIESRTFDKELHSFVVYVVVLRIEPI